MSSRGCVLLVLLASACTSGSARVPEDGAAGTGSGGAGSGGAGSGGAGTGGAGTGGAGTGGPQLPACLRDLFAACPITGACTYTPNDAGAAPLLCYASGASSVTTGSVCSTSSGGQTTIVNKADKSLCYTVFQVANQWQACESETYRWTDAGGALVATATVRGSTIPGGVFVGCGGGSETSISNNWADAPTLFGHDTCTAGSCP